MAAQADSSVEFTRRTGDETGVNRCGNRVQVENADGMPNSQADPLHVSPVPWQYLGGEVITPGGVSVQATLPAGTTIFEVAPEGEDMYYLINGGAAGTLSPGYVADGGRELVGPLSNLNTLSVYMAGVNIIHLQYFRET